MTISTIKTRRDFLAMNGSQRKHVASGFILVGRRRPDDHPVTSISRIGYTVTKKMGNAVIRNRIKRRLREAARRMPPSLIEPCHDYIVISRPKALDCDFSKLVGELEIAFSRIHANKSAV